MGKEIGPEAYKKFVRLMAKVVPPIEAKRAAAKEKDA